MGKIVENKNIVKRGLHMEYLLRNSELEIRVLSHGAELSGIKDLKTNEEYMWQKDPKFLSLIHI